MIKKADKIQFHALQAQWWMLSAQTGHTTKRQMFKSVNSIGDTPMTDQEKIDDAMKIAQNQLRLMHEVMESPDSDWE